MICSISNPGAIRGSGKCLWPLVFLLVAGIGINSRAQDQAPASDADPGQPPDTREAILNDQSRLAEDYRLLEEKLFSLYQYEQDQNPDRAQLLQNAYQQSREKLTLGQFRSAVQMLQQARLRDAERNQATANEHLQQLLELLQSEDRSQRIRKDLDRYREFLKEVDRIMRVQQGLRGRAENAADSAAQAATDRLLDQQDQLARRTGELQDDMTDDDSQPPPGDGESPPGESPPTTDPSTPVPDPPPNESADQNPADSGNSALEQARQGMQRAAQALQQARQSKAVDEMRAAEEQLARAREELEKILRQLREEEIERSLASLESRFRKMLELQLKIHEETRRLDLKYAGTQDPELGIQANRLAGSQRELVTEAGRAGLVLEDDGSSVATIETVRQIGIDLQQIVDRLAATRTGEITQQIQTDVIETLGFLVEAFEQAQRDADQQTQDSSGEQGDQQPGEQALVNRLAELKLIKGLQSRILNRHKRYAALLADPEDLVGYSDQPDIRRALGQLADRQVQLYQVTRDIVVEEKRRQAEQGR